MAKIEETFKTRKGVETTGLDFLLDRIVVLKVTFAVPWIDF